MEQYIPKSALVAEIERILDNSEEVHNNQYILLCNHFKHFIDTLEVKEVDFEREMQAFANINLEPLVISDSNIGISITMSQLYDCAKHFYKLGLKTQKGE